MEIVYSRDGDGNDPVHILDSGGYEIHKPEGIIKCPSARQLIITLTGHPQARNWTFNRYFRQGQFTPPELLAQPITPVLELFEPGGIVTDAGLVIPPRPKLQTSSITIHPESLHTGENLPEQAVETSAKLGIDLNERGGEVAKLLFAGFKNWIFGSRYDPQDVLQEVDRITTFPENSDGRIDPLQILQKLPELGILSLMIEGGSQVLSSFMAAGMIDELFVVYAPSVIGVGISPFESFKPESWDWKPRYTCSSIKRVGSDLVVQYTREGYPFLLD